MSFGQRFMYVGVGGSGQTIGRELETMLRNQICGPNGNKARLGDGKLPDLRAHELPRFIQTVYIDFAESDLEATKASLRADPKIVEATATFIHALPNFSASNQITNQLRTVESEITDSWLPPRTGDWGTEPTFAPLAVGAGQYPTIGRAALFAMLHDRGAEGLLGQFDVALGRITSSKGDLERYNPGGQVSDKVIILVGGSLSGGTGGGIMYDIIQLVTHRATKLLGADVTVVPLVALPRNFDAVLGESKRRSSRLNAARGLADLGALIDIQNAPPPKKQDPVHYPHKISFEMPAGIVKSAFLFDTPVDMKGQPIERSIARFALDLVSDVEAQKTQGVGSASQRYMPLLDKLVNDTGLLQLDHPTFVGKRPFAMAATVEIHDEMHHVATRIAEDLFREYLLGSVLENAPEARKIPGVREEFSRRIGMLPPEQIRELEKEKAQCVEATNERQLKESLAIYERKLRKFCSAQEASDRFADARQSMQGVEKVLSADSYKLGRIISEIALAKNSPITSTLLAIEGALDDIKSGNLPAPVASLAMDKPREFKTPREYSSWSISFPPRRTPNSDIGKQIDRVTAEQVYFAWKAYLNSAAGQPIKSRAGETLERVRQIIEALKSKAESFEDEKGSREASLATAALLSNSPDPTEYYRGIKARTYEALAEGLVDNKALPDIAKKIILEVQEYGLANWQRQEAARVDKLAESLIEAIKRAILEKLDKRAGLYTSLQSLLDQAEVTRDSATAEDSAVARLGSMILNKVNTSLVPPVISADSETRVTVSFPGDDAPKKRDWLRHILSQNPLVQPHLERMTFVPRSASDSIAVGISVVGLGLLDVPDGAASVNTWVNAAHSPKGTDRLAWRQRLGYRDSIAFVTEEGRIAMIQRLIAAAYNGRLKEVPADPSDKKSFATLVLSFGNEQAEPIRIPLSGAFPDRLSQVPDAFLESIAADFAAGRGRAVGQILDELADIVPEGAKNGRIPTAKDVPDLFKVLVGRHFRTGSDDAAEELRDIRKKIATVEEEKRRSGDLFTGELRLGALKEYEKFWVSDVPAALRLPYNILGYNSLWEICSATEGFEERRDAEAGDGVARKRR